MLIETADSKQPFACAGKQIEHSGPARRIVVGAQESDRLVEQIPDFAFEPHALAVEPHILLSGDDAETKLANGFPIDGDAAGENKFFAVAARACPGHRQVALQADPFVVSPVGLGISHFPFCFLFFSARSS